MLSNNIENATELDKPHNQWYLMHTTIILPNTPKNLTSSPSIPHTAYPYSQSSLIIAAAFSASPNKLLLRCALS